MDGWMAALTVVERSRKTHAHPRRLIARERNTVISLSRLLLLRPCIVLHCVVLQVLIDDRTGQFLLCEEWVTVRYDLSQSIHQSNCPVFSRPLRPVTHTSEGFSCQLHAVFTQ